VNSKHWLPIGALGDEIGPNLNDYAVWITRFKSTSRISSSLLEEASSAVFFGPFSTGKVGMMCFVVFLKLHVLIEKHTSVM